MIRNVRIWITVALCTAGNALFAFQGTSDPGDSVTLPTDWFLLSQDSDHFPGVAADEAYTLLKGHPSKTVIVAVIDGGVDIDHEDLKDIIWTNKGEIPDNGIDDDHNGYIDDVHGWNFIGGKDGQDVDVDTYEVTREYARLKPKWENVDSTKISKKDRTEYAYWLRVRNKYKHDFNANNDQYQLFKKEFTMYFNIYQTIYFSDSVIKAHDSTIDDITPDILSQVDTKGDSAVAFAKDKIQTLFDNLNADLTINQFLSELEDYLGYMQDGLKHYATAVEYGYNLDYNTRTTVGDDPNNLYEKGYGNNDVKGPDPMHGTHVSGIIGAIRTNDIGIRGIADNVRIMPVRAVPNGDERDKDIANAILYAVNNGARIINMSFGKPYSPHKEAVDKAVKYAESKGVLLIHAAGNDSNNTDIKEKVDFPTPVFLKGKPATDWIQVGASSWSADEHLAASFSNYGKKSVDLFAPGVAIYSTVPNDGYDSLDGTSMASPEVTGVAALLLEYFPTLTDIQIKDILEKSVSHYDLEVIEPGTDDVKVPFSNLSETGGIVNAYEAVKLALAMTSNDR